LARLGWSIVEAPFTGTPTNAPTRVALPAGAGAVHTKV